MTWFKVDDGWHKNRKRIRAGLDMEGFAARGLWVDAGSWSSDEGTDGWIPLDILDYLAPGLGLKLADRLVRSGLWHPMENRADGDGFQYHDWADFNPLSDEVAERLAKLSEGGERGNHTRWHANRGVVDPTCLYCSPRTRRGGRGAHQGQQNRTSPPRSDSRSAGESGAISPNGRQAESGANPPSRPDPTPIVVTQKDSLTAVSPAGAGARDYVTDFPQSTGSQKPASTTSNGSFAWCDEHRQNDSCIFDLHRDYKPPEGGLAAARKAVAENRRAAS